LLGQFSPHRIRQRLQIATGDLVLILPIEPADTTAALAAMLQHRSARSISGRIQLLLKSGADPNQSSARGETALMASALDRLFDEHLAKAGANINAQNSVGTTALMILAAKSSPDEI
jgi:hypothetical protein